SADLGFARGGTRECRGGWLRCCGLGRCLLRGGWLGGSWLGCSRFRCCGLGRCRLRRGRLGGSGTRLRGRDGTRGRGGGLLRCSWLRCWRTGLGGGLRRGRLAVGVGLGPTGCMIVFLHLLHIRRFDGGRCGLDVLTLLLERGEQFLAGNTELLRELVYT